MKHAITNGKEWLSGRFVKGSGVLPVMTANSACRYEYDTFEQADDAITQLYQMGYIAVGDLRVVPV